MKRLEVGMKVERRGEWNDYLVLKADEKFALVKCVSFVRTEDLGDLIFCTRADQEIWIAQYHACGFDRSPW